MTQTIKILGSTSNTPSSLGYRQPAVSFTGGKANFYIGNNLDDPQQINDAGNIANLPGSNGNYIYNNSGSFGAKTPTQVTADLDSFVGDSGSGGTKGLVPAPSAGDAAASKFLKADGTWSTLSGGALDANKTVSGAVNGSNVTFTLPSAPQGQIMLYASGVRLKPTDDYSISGDTITMVTAPTTGTVLLADYGVGVGVSDGDKGDITVSSNGTVWTVDNGLAATKIADGSVTDAEFQYLGGVTSDIQTQINTKAPLASPTFTGTVKGVSIPFTFAISDETTDITTGTSKITFRVPYACTLTAVRASLSTASSSGIPTFDINKNGTTVLSTKLTIDANEKTSVTATTAAVISVSSFADDDEVTVDVDVAGTGATGAKITMYLTRV